VPYIGDLIGYGQVNRQGPQGSSRSFNHGRRVLVNRRDVANTIRNRRRKRLIHGRFLDPMADDVSGWTVGAIEMYTGLAFTQNLNHLRIDIGRTA
jgi:hypothetical protein